MGRAVGTDERASEPCKHGIIIVVRENTGLSSVSRLVGSAPLVLLRVALKIMTARASMLRPPFPFSVFPHFHPTSFISVPSLPPVVPNRLKIFLRYVTDRPFAVNRVSLWPRRGLPGWKAFFFPIVCPRGSFRTICLRPIALNVALRSWAFSVLRIYALQCWQQTWW